MVPPESRWGSSLKTNTIFPFFFKGSVPLASGPFLCYNGLVKGRALKYIRSITNKNKFTLTFPPMIGGFLVYNKSMLVYISEKDAKSIAGYKHLAVLPPYRRLVKRIEEQL